VLVTCNTQQKTGKFHALVLFSKFLIKKEKKYNQNKRSVDISVLVEEEDDEEEEQEEEQQQQKQQQQQEKEQDEQQEEKFYTTKAPSYKSTYTCC